MTKPKRKIVHIAGVHWTKVPENKEILREIRLEGARTLDRKRKDAGWVAKQPGRKKQHKSKTLSAKQAADKLTHERELRRIRDQAYRARKAKINQETIGNDQEEINQIEQEHVAAGVRPARQMLDQARAKRPQSSASRMVIVST